MTQIVVVAPGTTDIVASGPQFGVPFELTSSEGVRCVFNDPEDADYVGWLTNISGLDSPDVRENADDLVSDDGGIHGDFFYGRRPIVFEGAIEPRPDNTSRNLRMTRLQRATSAMRTDAELRWMPEGGIQQYVSLRRQQPLRITGSYIKTFQLSMVAADPRIYSAEIKEMRALPNDLNVLLENKGSTGTPLTATLVGPANNIQIQNHTTGEAIVFASTYTLAVGQVMKIDFANRTVLMGTTNLFDKVVFGSTTWFQLQPGLNQVSLSCSASDANTALTMQWRDAWI